MELLHTVEEEGCLVCRYKQFRSQIQSPFSKFKSLSYIQIGFTTVP